MDIEIAHRHRSRPHRPLDVALERIKTAQVHRRASSHRPKHEAETTTPQKRADGFFGVGD